MMFKKLILTIVFCCSIASFGCNAQNKVKNPSYGLMLKTLLSHSVEETTIDDLEVLEKNNIILLDAREKREFEVSHMNNALWVGYDDFSPKRVKDIPKDAKVIVYCSVGYRSEKVSEQLLDLGYTNVSNLYGGLFEWVNQGNEVVTDDTTTEKVHAYDKLWGVWLDTEKNNKIYR